MATKGRKGFTPRQTPWRFYVYALTLDGTIQYVGKGSGARLRAQCKSHGLQGYEVARFHRERDAYAFEVEHIAEHSPALNKHPGGIGPRCRPQPGARRDPFEILCEKIGTRAVAARILLSVHAVAPHLLPEPSKIGEIRRIAYGLG